MSLKVALIDQRVVAGLGNIYVERSAPPRAALAAPASVDDSHPDGRTARRRAPARRGHQAGARRGDRADHRRDLPGLQVPRLRPRRRSAAVSAAARGQSEDGPGRPLDVLLPALSALAPAFCPPSSRPVTITTNHAGARVLPLQAVGRRGRGARLLDDDRGGADARPVRGSAGGVGAAARDRGGVRRAAHLRVAQLDHVLRARPATSSCGRRRASSKSASSSAAR